MALVGDDNFDEDDMSDEEVTVSFPNTDFEDELDEDDSVEITEQYIDYDPEDWPEDLDE